MTLAGPIQRYSSERLFRVNKDSLACQVLVAPIGTMPTKSSCLNRLWD